MSNDERLLTVPQIAKRIGMSRDFVVGLLDDGVLPHRPHRRRRYVTERALREWLGEPVTHHPPVTVHEVEKRRA